MLALYEPFVWTPRLGLFARLRTLRPVVWSWDRLLLPQAIILTMFASVGAVYQLTVPPVVSAIVVFAEILVLHRCGVTPEEWQMTSDARLIHTSL